MIQDIYDAKEGNREDRFYAEEKRDKTTNGRLLRIFRVPGDNSRRNTSGVVDGHQRE